MVHKKLQHKEDNICDILKQLRRKRGYTMHELAKLVHLRWTHIDVLEHSDNTDFNTMFALLDAMGYDLFVVSRNHSHDNSTFKA